MITLLQQTGRNALLNVPSTSKLRFTGFKVGDKANVAPRADYTDAQGNIVYTGNEADMRYVPFHGNGIILQFIIPAHKPEIRISNIMLFVNFTTPFCLCISSSNFVKLATVNSNAGIRFIYQLVLSIPDLFNFIEVNNITQNLAEFTRVVDQPTLDAQYVPLNGYDQGILLYHDRLGRAIPLLVIGNEIWGCPLFAATDDPGGFRINGGDIGDGYKYTYTPETELLVWDDTKFWNDANNWIESL